MLVVPLQQTVKKVLYFLCVAGGLSLTPSACSQSAPKEERRSLDSPENKKNMTINHNNNPFSIVKTEAEWRAQLGPEAYRVLREKGTERPFTSPFETEWDAGFYVC
jgi:peptide-methionine (R)-S-oxide reductase